MSKSQKQKQQKQIRHANVLENLKDIGASGASQEFLSQLFDKRHEKKHSGDIGPGETLEFDEVLSGRHEETLKLKKQLTHERRLAEEEIRRVEKKSNELKVQLHALMQEVTTLADTTQDLAEETQIAAMQAPVEPGVYHLIFFEKLLEFIKSFRKKIEEAKVWLQASNKRAQKKNFWARYKKHGGKFLLSPDHYLTRSAG